MELNKLENTLLKFKEVYKKRNKNIFEIAGFPKRERVSSNILKFYLDGTEEHKLGTMVLEALLKSANINNVTNINDVKVETEYYTKNGKAIDLILYNDEFVIGIENKLEADVYNDLQDYANMLENFNPNAYKIILSLYDETKKAKEYNYINVTYERLFQYLEPMLNNKPQPNNKWYIYLQDYISNIKRLGGNDMERQEMIEWAKNNKNDIEEFYDFLLNIKKMLNSKSTNLGNILAERIKKLNLNGRVWYWNKSGNYEDEMCTMTVIELDNQNELGNIAIDSQIGLDGWKIYVTLRDENSNISGRKSVIIDVLMKNNIEVLNNDGNKLLIGRYDYYCNNEQIAEGVINILKLFQ